MKNEKDRWIRSPVEALVVVVCAVVIGLAGRLAIPFLAPDLLADPVIPASLASSPPVHVLEHLEDYQSLGGNLVGGASTDLAGVSWSDTAISFHTNVKQLLVINRDTDVAAYFSLSGTATTGNAYVGPGESYTFNGDATSLAGMEFYASDTVLLNVVCRRLIQK